MRTICSYIVATTLFSWGALVAADRFHDELGFFEAIMLAGCFSFAIAAMEIKR